MSNYTVPIGPVHVVLEEPIYFKLSVEGETVKGVDITAGHVHRGIEFLAMQRNIYQNITLTERVCSLCSNNHPFTYCMALEKIAKIEVPVRAEFLRVIADEIKRVASNLFNAGILAHIIGYDSLFMHIMEIREIMQDVKETLYGNRMDLAANCIGGVKYDLNPEQVRYLTSNLDKLKKPLEELIKIFNTDKVILLRTQGVGVLTLDKAIEYGVVGPVARGSGVAYDVRKQNPYAAYNHLDFNVITETGGDAHARALVRLQEIVEAIKILEQAVKLMPEGPTCLDYLPEIPAGEGVAKSEAPRGELMYFVKTDGTDIPERLKWRVPTYMHWEALQEMMPGSKLADIPVIVGSIDPCISCTER